MRKPANITGCLQRQSGNMRRVAVNTPKKFKYAGSDKLADVAWYGKPNSTTAPSREKSKPMSWVSTIWPAMQRSGAKDWYS